MRERGATNLKLQCRAGCLPVMTRVMKEVGVPVEWGVCLMSDSGRAENIDHVLLDCSAYNNQRKRLMHKVAEAVSAASRGGDRDRGYGKRGVDTDNDGEEGGQPGGSKIHRSCLQEIPEESMAVQEEGSERG